MFILPGNLRSRRPGLVALFDDPYRRSRPAPCGGGDLEGGDAYESPDSLGKRRDFACLEALGRTLCGIAPWLELDGESDPRQAEYRLLARRALSWAVDPSDAGYLTFDRGRQPLVDAAYLAEGVLRAKRQLWTELDAAARANLIDALKRTRTIRPGETNWLLFASMVEAALLELSGSCDTARMRYGTDRFLNDFYKGDGMYGDGKFFHMDYYNSYVIHPMLLDVLSWSGTGWPTAVRWRPNAAAIPVMRPFWNAWWLPTGVIRCWDVRSRPAVSACSMRSGSRPCCTRFRTRFLLPRCGAP